MRAVVVALGKIGLPLAAQLARTGHDVIGCDLDERVVADVNAAREPFPGEAELGAVLEAVVLGEARDACGPPRTPPRRSRAARTSSCSCRR